MTDRDFDIRPFAREMAEKMDRQLGHSDTTLLVYAVQEIGGEIRVTGTERARVDLMIHGVQSILGRAADTLDKYMEAGRIPASAMVIAEHLRTAEQTLVAGMVKSGMISAPTAVIRSKHDIEPGKAKQ